MAGWMTSVHTFLPASRTPGSSLHHERRMLSFTSSDLRLIDLFVPDLPLYIVRLWHGLLESFSAKEAYGHSRKPRPVRVGYLMT